MLVASQRFTMTALLEYLDLLLQDIGQKMTMPLHSTTYATECNVLYIYVFHLLGSPVVLTNSISSDLMW